MQLTPEWTDCWPGGPADADIGAPFFTSTGDVDALMDQLQAATDGLNGDVTSWYKSAPKTAASDNYANAWIKWRDAAYGTIKTWRNGLFHLAWNWYDAAQSKLAQLNDWRTSFQAVSGRAASGPAPRVPPSSSVSTIITAAVVLAALGGAAYVGVQIYAAAKTAKTARAVFAPALSGARRGRFSGAEPVVKRAPDFADTGSYEVTAPDGRVHRIYRDPENKWWYVEGPGHYSDRCVGFTKKEAVARVVERK